MIPNHAQYPVSWVGTEHYLKSALVRGPGRGRGVPRVAPPAPHGVQAAGAGPAVLDVHPARPQDRPAVGSEQDARGQGGLSAQITSMLGSLA